VDQLLAQADAAGASTGTRQVNQRLPSGREVPVGFNTVRMDNDRILAIGKDMQSLADLQQRLVEAQQAMEQDYWQLRQVQTRYRLLFQRSPDGVMVVDARTGAVSEANAAAADLMGTTVEELTDAEHAFPEVLELDDPSLLEDHLEEARELGAADAMDVETRDGRRIRVRTSLMPADPNPLFLVHVRAAGPSGAEEPGAPVPTGLREQSDLFLERAPDAFVLMDDEGTVLRANRAFAEMAQLSGPDGAVGKTLGRWLGRPGADLTVLLAMIRKHEVIRVFSTSIQGDLGGQTEVEISAAGLPGPGSARMGLSIRDVGRRLRTGRSGARDLSRAVEQLTELVGRTSLKKLVRDTVDMVEAHFIEAALELTDDNRTAAAELLGVSRQSLYTKLRRYDLSDNGSSN
jgi:transcriptional regulator PpsR